MILSRQMKQKDLFLGIASALLTAIFLIPTLINTGYFYKIPAVWIVLFIFLPASAATGLVVAYFLGKTIPLIWQFAKFVLVGVLNTAIDFGILNLIIFLTGVTQGIGIFFTAAISFSVATVNSYFWNREFTFASKKKAVQSFPIFLTVTLIGLLINASVVYFLSTYILPSLITSPNLRPNVAKVAATAVTMFWNFAGYKLIVFKK